MVSIALSCEKGGLAGYGDMGNGTTAMVLMDGDPTPLGVIITAANEAEVTPIERLLKASVVTLSDKFRLLYDGAADSDRSRERWQARGVELICPHRSNRLKPATQDGRKLRRRRHRWKVERTNAWLQNYGRIGTRKDVTETIFPSWVQLA